jgi:hypothetical protein
MKNRQQAHFKLIAEYLSNLERNYDFYIQHLKEGVGNKDMLKIEDEILRACFEVTNNPIFLWRAIKTCVNAEIDFQSWITDYLFKAASKIMESAYNPPSKKSEKDILADALMFNSSGSVNNFTKYKPSLERFSRVSKVMQKRMTSDLTFEKIEAQIAHERYPDDERAEEAEARKLKKWREKLQKIPDNLDLG